MIPKIIHYCWFGRGAMPASAYKCIDSWKKFLPDYEIKLWNEDNFDVNMIPYTREAYEAKKFAFVSDFARFWVLYKYGGLYYSSLHFTLSENGMPPKTIVDHTTSVLCRHGLKATNDIQLCAGVWIYPKEYFAPKDVDTHLLEITDNTRTIHHYDASWAEWYDKAAGIRGIKLRKILGQRIGNFINVIIYEIQKHGLQSLIRKAFHRLVRR